MNSLNFKIVADSSADMTSWSQNIDKAISYASVPLKIITSAKEYVDNEELDVSLMVNELADYKGRSSSSCPNPSDWLEAFGDSENIFCVTITSGLSGSYNSACMAKEEYEVTHPGRKVFVVDTLSAGPELRLIIEKLAEYISQGKDFEQICRDIALYQKKTGLLFMLESMKNLANNGRVSPLTAKLAGILGIRVIGKASDNGVLEPLEKSRGEGKAISTMTKQLNLLGHNGGKIRIAHCMNEKAAQTLKDRVAQEFKDLDIEIYGCGGLCSFYAERGGMLVGFEKI